MLPPDRIMFHGTNSSYVEEQVKLYGRYQHLLQYVDLTNSSGNGIYSAVKSVFKRLGTVPVLLVIDTTRVTARFGKNPRYWCVPYLDLESYLSVNLIYREGMGYVASDLELAIKKLLG
jgi:hypothetical protein